MRSTLFEDTTWKPAATFSPCGRYRYTLTRGCGHGTDSVNWIMLNPSTADAEKDDPTIRRVMGFTKNWGYADCVVTNLFAWRATDPKELRRTPDPIGPDNNRVILETAVRSTIVVCAWGSHGIYRNRAAAVLALLSGAGLRPFYLRITATGQPAHPLYLPADLAPRQFD